MNYSEKLTRWMLEDTLTRYPAFDIQNEIKELLDLGVLMIFVSPDKKTIELQHKNLNLRYVLEEGRIDKIETLDTGSLTKNLISLLEENLNQLRKEDENIYTAIYKKYLADIAEIYKGLENNSKSPSELNVMMVKLMQKITSDFIKAKDNYLKEVFKNSEIPLNQETLDRVKRVIDTTKDNKTTINDLD